MDAQTRLEWLLLGMALSDKALLRRVNPNWWTDDRLRGIVSECQARLSDKSQELPELTALLKDTGCVSWEFQGTIDSVASAKERISERVDVNSQFAQAWIVAADMFRLEAWARDGYKRADDETVMSTEEKLVVISRFLEKVK